jgi:hypothetical protein
MAEFEYIASVTNGELKIPQSKRLKEDAKQFEGKQVIIKLYEHKNNKRNTFNRFYWGYVIRPILKGLTDVGYNTDEIDEESVHQYLKNRFLSKDIHNEDGEVLTIQGSTKKLSNIEMMEYIDEVIQWSAEFLGVIINFPWDSLGENEKYNL